MKEESKDDVFKGLLESWDDGWCGVDGEMSTNLRESDRRRAEEKKEWEARWDRAVG
jgi:hypothetical protein